MRYLQIIFLSFIAFNCFAGVEYKKFNNPQQEQDYKVLIEELRCLVCQNQTIASSNADLAKDLRRQVYEMLEQGNSKDEIVEFMIQRYGDFVMYNPPFKAKTSLLWLGPVVFLLIGLVLLFILSKRKKNVAIVELSDQEHATKVRVKKFLSDGEQK